MLEKAGELGNLEKSYNGNKVQSMIKAWDGHEKPTMDRPETWAWTENTGCEKHLLINLNLYKLILFLRL